MGSIQNTVCAQWEDNTRMISTCSDMQFPLPTFDDLFHIVTSQTVEFNNIINFNNINQAFY